MKIRHRTICILAGMFLATGAMTVHGGPYDAWTFRMNVRFAGYDKAETLANFPVLVTLSTNIAGFLYSDFGSPADGADLRFASSNEATELNYEIEKWDTNGNSYVWVQVPAIGGTNDFIYSYWGCVTNAAVCTTNGGTWTNGYQGVWHMQGPDATDSSTNGNNGTAAGGVSAVTGKVGLGNSFDGTGWITVPATDLFKGSDDVTVEFWFNMASASPESYPDILDYDHATASQNFAVQVRSGERNYSWPLNSAENNSWGPWDNGSEFTVQYSQWMHVALIKSGTSYSFYTDGTRLLSGACSAGIDKATRMLRLGGKVSGGGRIRGILDEVRISNTGRSSNWVYACWLNQASNSTFLVASDAGPLATNLTVRADTPASVGTNSATMRGMVLHTGEQENPEVYICWAYTNAGTISTSTWAHVEFLGTNWGAKQAFQTNITGLLSGSTYVYRCYVTNSTGFDWSDDAKSFTAVYMPVVTNLGAASVKASSAWLKGQVTDTGAEAPTAWFQYWADGGAVTSTVSAGQQPGVFSNRVSSLAINSLYHYQVIVSNVAGVATSTVTSFTTLHTLYVATTGSGLGGTNWATAFTSLQAAVDAGGSDATILIKEGTYASDTQVVVSNMSAFVIKGGYVGNTPEPGDLSSNPTILTRGAAASRIFYGYSSTVTLERVIIQSGYLTDVNPKGAGLYFTNCQVTLRNCMVTNNVTYANSSCQGAGLYANGGVLNISDSIFVNNSTPKYDYGTSGYGGGLWADNVSVTLTNTLFKGNWTRTRHVASFGGAICLNSGQAEIRDCRFESNFAGMDGNGDGPGPGYGGAIYATNVIPLILTDCHFATNRIHYYDNVYGSKLGGAVYIGGAFSRVSMNRCVFVGNGDLSDESGDIYMADGTLGMTNVLVAGSSGGSGVFIAGGSAAMDQCTFANNILYGFSRFGGSATVRNTIAKLNGLGGINDANTVTYSCAQEHLDGVGNSIAESLFADTTYYHLQSRAGNYSGGFFAGGSWTTSAQDSPLIDAGDPTSSSTQEPPPSGFRANIGAYGGSSVASKTYLEAPGVFTTLTGYAHPAVPVTETSIWLRGQVLSAGGGDDPVAALCWGDIDGGTGGTNAWQNVANMGTKSEWALFTNLVTGLTQGNTYHCRCYVTNSTGQDWSSDVTFMAMVPPSVTNLGPTQVRRHSAKLQGQVLTSGGEDPAVWIWHWQDGSVSTSIVEMGVQTIYASFTTNITSLSADTLYHYKILASNSEGSVWSTTHDYSTLSTNPIGRYVTVLGAGAKDGTSWWNAHPGLKKGLEDCAYPGDTLYVQYGTFQHVANVDLSALSGAIISGGYVGSGTPGNRTNAQTVFTRVMDKYIRVFYGNATTVTLDRVTVANARLTAPDSDGGGLYFTGNSSVTLTNCMVSNNVIAITGTADGAGLYMNGGILKVFDSSFMNNSAPKTDVSGGGRGNAVAAFNVAFTFSGSRFEGNYMQTRHVAAIGGALYLSGGKGLVTNCQFDSNSCINEGNTDGPGPARGGGLAALDVGSIMVTDCYFTNNRACTLWSPDGGSRQGSAMYFLNSTGSVNRCVLFVNGHGTDSGGTLYSEGGLVGITNVLAAYGQGANAIYVNGAGSIASVTAVSNGTWGIRGNGTTPVKNSIAWMNAAGGIVNCDVSYTCSQEAHAGTGNVSANPMFADSSYFHIQSRSGNYVDGFFSGGTWVRSSTNSPLIDAGDLSSARALEPAPNGSRVNMGYDGNTTVASLSANAGSVFVVH